MKKLLLAVALFTVLFAQAQWEPDVRLTNSPDSSMLSYNSSRCIAATGDTVHIVWYDNREGAFEIYYKRSTDGGLTWGEDTRLSENDAVTSNTPSISLYGSAVHVVWRDYRDGNMEIYYIRSIDGGNTWGPEQRLTTDPELSYSPTILACGLFLHVVWVDSRDQISSTPRQIYYKRSLDGGLTWEPDMRLSLSPSYALNPSIAGSGQNVHVVWNDKRDGNMEIYYRRSDQNGATWGAEVRLTNDNSMSQIASIAISGQNVHIAWQNSLSAGNTAIYYIHSPDKGLTWQAIQQITSIPANYMWPNLTASGSLVHMVWQDDHNGYYGINYTCSTDNGISWSAAIQLNDISIISDKPFIAVSGPVLHVIWHDYRDLNYEIYYKRNPTGGFAVGFDNHPEQKIRIYPNPARNTVNIIFESPTDSELTIRFTDMLSRTIKEQSIQVFDAKNHYLLNVEEIPEGLYTVELRNRDHYYFSKIMIKK